MGGHGSTDDYDIGHGGHIRRGEITARQQARPDRVEVARRHRLEIRPRVLPPGGVRAKALLRFHDRERVVTNGSAQRPQRNGAGAAHMRQRLHPILQRLEELVPLFPGAGRRLKIDGDQAVSIEAQRRSIQLLNTPREQGGTRQ